MEKSLNIIRCKHVKFAMQRKTSKTCYHSQNVGNKDQIHLVRAISYKLEPTLPQCRWNWNNRIP